MPFKITNKDLFEYGIAVFRNRIPLMQIHSYDTISLQEYCGLLNNPLLANKNSKYRNERENTGIINRTKDAR